MKTYPLASTETKLIILEFSLRLRLPRGTVATTVLTPTSASALFLLKTFRRVAIIRKVVVLSLLAPLLDRFNGLLLLQRALLEFLSLHLLAVSLLLASLAAFLASLLLCEVV